MSDLKKKRKKLSSTLRNYFITGVVVLIPIGITLYLTKFLIQVSSKIIPSEINPNNYTVWFKIIFQKYYEYINR